LENHRHEWLFVQPRYTVLFPVVRVVVRLCQAARSRDRDTCCFRLSESSESRHMLPLPVVRVVQVVRVATHAAPGCRIVSLRLSLFQNLNRGRGRRGASDSEPRRDGGPARRRAATRHTPIRRSRMLYAAGVRVHHPTRSHGSGPATRAVAPSRSAPGPGWHPALTVAAPVYDGVTGSGSSRPAVGPQPRGRPRHHDSDARQPAPI
jgi:hypothetical protein